MPPLRLASVIEGRGRVARQALCAEQTGITHFRLRPGKRSPFSHGHTDAEEIYVILPVAGS